MALENYRMKGIIVVTTLSYIHHLDRINGLQRIKSQLDNETMMIFDEQIDINRWYPIEYEISMLRAIENIFGSGDGRTIWNCGRYAADYIIGNLSGIVFRYGEPDLFVSQAPSLWSLFYTWGPLEVLENSEQYAEVVVRNDLESRELKLRVAGWMERSLEIIGCRNIKVEFHEESDDSGRSTYYRASWIM